MLSTESSTALTDLDDTYRITTKDVLTRIISHRKNKIQISKCEAQLAQAMSIHLPNLVLKENLIHGEETLSYYASPKELW